MSGTNNVTEASAICLIKTNDNKLKYLKIPIICSLGNGLNVNRFFCSTIVAG